MGTRITALRSIDVRFPTSDFLDGSDAMNPDPDYSAATVVLETNEPGLEGHGLTFTIGRGNDLCCHAIDLLAERVVGRDLDEIGTAMGALWRDLVSDSQLRWLGPEKGVTHMATSAVVNAVWDLLARRAGKPVWKLVADMSPEAQVELVDFRHISDAITPGEALDRLRALEETRGQREAELRRDGYPAYITSAGWLGYDDDKIRRLCRASLAEGWTKFKMKVGRDVEDDLRRGRIVLEEIGADGTLMIDANQVWDVGEAIDYVNALAELRPLWIEEPTSPDDILGHARIRREVHPIGVATGEHCHNRVMWKQLFEADAVDYAQIDGCRLAGLNEVFAVLLMAAKFGVPVCPHAGGVGLCEYVQHFSILDYICVSGSLEGRVTEYAEHLHDHFVHPVEVSGGRYRVPQAPGFSVEMKRESRERHTFPTGAAWKDRS